MIKETIPFNFDEVYVSVREKFIERGYDIQEGSNTMQLVTAMAYLVSSLNANTAVNINETLLPLARKRKMVLQNARILGYEVMHKLSYQYRLTLEFPVGQHSINRYDYFEADGKRYYYMGDPILTFSGPSTQVIDVVEGDLKLYDDEPSLNYTINRYFDKDAGQYRFDHFVSVPFFDVEENGLDVFATYYDTDGNLRTNERWNKVDKFIIDVDTVAHKNFVRLDSLEYSTPRIYFGVDGISKPLRENTKIKVNALLSSGVDGEISGVLKPVSLDCTITDTKLIRRGANEESSDDIKKNAPIFNNSANRLVTKLDYLGFINRQPTVKFATTWDGADEEPLKPGHIWLTYYPQHTIKQYSTNTLNTLFELDVSSPDNWYLSDEDVNAITESMKPYNIPTLRYHHRQPIYVDFDFDIQIVRYNRVLTQEGWNESVFNIIRDYFRDNENFNFEYFQSSLDKRVDTLLTDESGFNVDLKTSITVSSKDISTEITDICDPDLRRSIKFHLGTPFEKFLSKNLLGEYIVDTTVLPVISGEFKINGAMHNISTDFADNSLIGTLQGRVMKYPIYCNSEVVGEYRLFLDSSDTIEVIIYIKTDDGYLTGFKEEDINNTKIGIKYLSPNFKFTRNSIPRLKRVNMVTR